MTGHQSGHTIHRTQHHLGWNNAFPPRLVVAPGETVEFKTVDASGGQISSKSTVADVAALDFGKVNPVSGPVYIDGAEPGDAVKVTILDFTPSGWGWTANIPGFGLLADEYPEPWLRISRVEPETGRVRFSDQVTLPYRPFPGTLGVAPDEPGEHSIVPPSRFGGNMDTKHLNPGVKLYLPIGVEGALFSLGDTHAAQGDGEVCGTAIETQMDVTLRLSVRRDFSVQTPQYDLPAGAVAAHEQSPYHVCTGVAPDLMAATKQAVRETIAFLGHRYGLDRNEAYAVASVAVDLRIHEVVDAPNWVVGAFIPESIFEGGI